MWRGVLFCLVIALLAACQRQMVLQGETGGTGSVVLLAEFPGNPDRVRLDSCLIEQGKWSVQAPGLVLPARVWIETGDGCFSFIADAYRGITIAGSFPDSLTVKGSRLERESGMVGQLLSERYQAPMESIREQIELIRRKPVRAKSDEKNLAALERNLERYGEYEARYLEKLVRANPKHELSLFILKEEVADSLVRQKLLKIVRTKNKKSNISQLLTAAHPVSK